MGSDDEEENSDTETVEIPKGCWFCLHCGHVNKKEAYYCAKCGRMPWYDKVEATGQLV